MMSKLPWVKYCFSIWIAAIVVSLVARYVTTSLLVLMPLCFVIYLLSVNALARVNGYQ